MAKKRVTNVDTTAKTLKVGDLEFYRYSGAGYGGEEDGILLGNFKAFVLKADRKLNVYEFERIAKIVSYYWKTMVKGTETIDSWYSAGDDTIVFNHGLFGGPTEDELSTSVNPQASFAEFALRMNNFIAEGSPVRKHGTRLIPGVEDQVEVSVWVDEVAEVIDFPDAPVISTKPAEEEKITMKKELQEEVTVTKDIGDMTINEIKELLAEYSTLQANNDLLRAENAELKDTLQGIRKFLG